MPTPFKHKLSDALRAQGGAAGSKRKAGVTPATEAEMTREAAESAQAHEAESSNRDRMVNIGRGNQQAGRQKGGRAR